MTHSGAKYMFLNRPRRFGKSLLTSTLHSYFKEMQQLLSAIPYCDNTRYEGHYQQVFYIIFSLLGVYVDVEVRTPRGRVDVVMRTPVALYVIELKLDKIE